MQTPRRFIAGAVCPQCFRPDKIVLYRTDNDICFECLACGFKQQQPYDVQLPPINEEQA